MIALDVARMNEVICGALARGQTPDIAALIRATLAEAPKREETAVFSVKRGRHVI